MLRARAAARAAQHAIGTERRPGDARGLQQPLHDDRRADGRAAAEHRLLGQHQGAARLLLRAVRRRRQPDRQRAAHAGAPGLDGREHQDRDRAQPGRCAPGDVYVLNDPYNGGTHLPDVTVVTPVFLEAERREAARSTSASRGHHADIGGITPGSMPPVSTTHRRGGRAVRQLPAGATTAGCARPSCARCWRRRRYPARNPDQNLADLRAQIAANEKGVQELRAMVAQFGLRRRCRPTWATCRTTPRRRCAASSPR